VSAAIDGPALGDAIARFLALDSQQREAMGARARARLVAGYSQEAMVSALLDVYAELV
jgi:glycosyltransferase involved in cell wall biosynthesis